jgi:hypothetical protein
LLALALFGCAAATYALHRRAAMPAVAPSAVVAEPAASADSMVNSVGVNTHLWYSRRVYYLQFSTLILPRMKELGVAHIRDHLAPPNDDKVGRMRQLFSLGIRASLIIDPRKMSAAQAAAYTRQWGPVVEAVEGPNEPDNIKPEVADPAWAPRMRQFIVDLHDAFRRDSSLRGVAILAPSFLKKETAGRIGDISPWIDFGNVHPYPFPRFPMEADPVKRDRKVFTPLYAAKPLIATETGYHTGGPRSDRPVSEALQAKYIARLLFENFNAGVVRSYLYELMDEGTDPDDREAHFGLVRADGTLKPAFVVVRNTLAILRSGGPGRPAGHASLAYGLEGGGSSLHHTLLQAASNEFFLILWLEVSSTDADLSMPVRLTLGQPVKEVQTFVPLTSADPQSRLPGGSRFELRVPDHPLIVRIVP